MSIIIKPKGRVHDLFQQLSKVHPLFISDISLVELNRHQKKILQLSGLNLADYELLKAEVVKQLSIISSHIISDEILIQSYHMVEQSDKNDIAFVAATFFADGILWTGDKKLYTALKKKGFQNVFNSKDISNLLVNE